MADEKLRLVIDALNQASDDLVKLKSELGGLDEQTKKADKSSKGFGDSWAGILTGLNSGIQIAKQAGLAIKQIYETARAAAELDYAKSKFDNLAESINTTSDSLMYKLREATQGIISDADAMSVASDVVSLGLVKNEDDVVRLASVYSALDMDMNQLTLTLANKTTMRFDQLGISIDGFDEKVKHLEATGLSTDAAFTEAFLQQAEAQVEKVGSAADSAVGPFLRLEAAGEDWFNLQKKNLADSKLLADILDSISTKLSNATDFQDAMNMAVQRGILTEEKMIIIQGDVHKGLVDIADITEYYNGLMYESPQLVDDWAAANYEYVTSQEEMNAMMQTAEQTIIDADLAMRSYNETLLFNIASEGLSDEAALELARAMGLVDEETVAATEKVNQWKEDLDNGLMTLEEYNNLVSGLADGLDRLHDVDVTVQTTYIEVYGRSQSGRSHGGNTEQARASGGPTMAGMPYVWNEYGGEARVDSNNGFVLSRADAERAIANAVNGGGTQYVYGGPSADDIARATRDALLTSGVI